MKSKKAKRIFNVVFAVVTMSSAVYCICDFLQSGRDGGGFERLLDILWSVYFGLGILSAECCFFLSIRYFLFGNKKSIMRTVFAIGGLCFSLIVGIAIALMLLYAAM